MLINLNGAPKASTQNTEFPEYELGSLAIVNDRAWRYVRATAAITAGEVVVVTSPSQVSNITGVQNTPDPGVGSPWIEDSGETMTVNYYKDCYLYISGHTGAGLMKRIVSNTATRIYYKAMYPEMGEADGFSTTPDTTTDYNILTPWHVKKAVASDKIQTPIGYAPFAFTAHYYGWVLASGMGNPAMGYASGSAVIDTLVVPGDDTAGQGTWAGPADDLGDATPFGVMMYAGANDTKWPVLFRGIGI